MKARLIGVIAAGLAVAVLLPNLAFGQKKTHSAVIGGVKQRFKNAVNDPGEAERIYQEAIDLLLHNNMVNDVKEKDKEESWFYLGAVYYRKGDFEKALEAMQNSLNHGKRFYEKGEKVSGGIEIFSIKETINDVKLKTFNKALRSFENALAMEPSDSTDKLFRKSIEHCENLLKWDAKVLINDQSRAPNVLNFMANSYIKLAERETDASKKVAYRSKTVESLSKLHETDPSNLSIIYNVFVQFYDQQNWEQAVVWIDKAMASPANDSLSTIIKSQLVERKAYIYDTVLKNPEMAEKTYQDLIQKDPNNPDWHFNLARLYFGRGDSEKAMNELKKVKVLRPDDPEANYQVADEMFFAYQKKRAKVIDDNGGLKADLKKVTTILQADIDECRKNLTDAATVLEKSLSNSNDLVETNYRIGKFYNLLAELEGHVRFNLENREKVKAQKPFFDKAVEYLKKTVELDDAHKEAWRNLFVAYTNLQMVKERDAAMKKFEALSK